LLSGSRKQSKPKKKEENPSGKLDPVKLAMVSDYLKRTISERPYGFIIASLAERLRLEELDFHLSSMGIITIPPEFDLKKIHEEKCISFMPYCCKPFDCPLNEIEGRKTSNCKAIDDSCDHSTCTIRRFINIAKKLGIEEYHIIDADVNLFKWLDEKRRQGYKHVVGIACEFAISYAFEVIHGQLGFNGVIILINGDKCKTKEEYAEMDSADRGRLTFIDDWTLSALEELISQIYDEEIPAKEDGSAIVDR